MVEYKCDVCKCNVDKFRGTVTGVIYGKQSVVKHYCKEHYSLIIETINGVTDNGKEELSTKSM